MRPLRAPAPAAAAVLVLAVVLGACGGSSGGSTGEGASSFPEAPDGMRWVGSGRVVVAVPDWWTTGETTCSTPVEDTVYFDPSVVADCVDTSATAAVREVSALAVLDGTGGYGEKELRTMRAVSEVSGHEVLERDGCEGWFEGVCRRLFAVPDEGVVFAVTIAEEGDGSYEDIRDSVRILPDGLTTVPLAIHHDRTPSWGAGPRATEALVAELEEAGLRVDVETVAPPDGDSDGGDYVSLPAGSLLEVSPSLGSVIEEGGTLTVSVAG